MPYYVAVEVPQPRLVSLHHDTYSSDKELECMLSHYAARNADKILVRRVRSLYKQVNLV